MGSEESSELNCCGQIFRWLFVIFNFIFVIIGLALLGVGIYLQVTQQNYSVITGSSLVSGAVLLIICGIVTFIIAAIGFGGACLKWRPLLVIYATVLSFLILLEIIVGIIGFVYRDTIARVSNDEYHDRWNKTIKAYRVQTDLDYDPSVNDAIDFFQKTLECCGIDQPSDWGTLNGEVLNALNNQLPASCSCTSDTNCVNVTFQYSYGNGQTNIINAMAWDKGCFNATIDVVIGFSTYIAIAAGGVGIAFGLIEILGIVISIVLCCCITYSRKMDTNV